MNNGTQNPNDFIGKEVTQFFASKEQALAFIRSKKAPPSETTETSEDEEGSNKAKANTILYSLTTMIQAGIIDLEGVKVLTQHLPNPDYNNIYVDPTAVDMYNQSFGEWSGVVFFQAAADGTVQLYRDPNGAIVPASTSFATPVAVIEYLKSVHNNNRQ